MQTKCRVIILFDNYRLQGREGNHDPSGGYLQNVPAARRLCGGVAKARRCVKAL